MREQPITREESAAYAQAGHESRQKVLERDSTGWPWFDDKRLKPALLRLHQIRQEAERYRADYIFCQEVFTDSHATVRMLEGISQPTAKQQQKLAFHRQQRVDMEAARALAGASSAATRQLADEAEKAMHAEFLGLSGLLSLESETNPLLGG